MTCDFHEWDAAYVLGSLSPAERTDYERHLAGCADCTAAVRELAGLPGLLARVPADVLEAPPEAVSVPETLLPALVAHARRDQRRRQTRTLLAAAAAVVVVGAGSAGLAASLADDDRPVPQVAPTAERLRMMPVGSGSSSGWVSLTEVAWGTRLELDCEYDSPYGGHAAYAYTLVVTTNDLVEQQVATWRAIPGKELHVIGSAAASPDDIATIEVRDARGEAVLRLTR
ncbi:anti-sigma factor [Nocardioides humilatus]|uniref:Anti-sigma factor n=1 Tax=Nocardioides humilatus TaxID=2607660 RepID=A0A5B1LKX7_9ACTN|nr:zf-HC2 domain-containing protein [Nocardioides humilatus]KAA1420277.1 anti-sigma factor [Nocardioides humilatus]